MAQADFSLFRKNSDKITKNVLNPRWRRKFKMASRTKMFKKIFPTTLPYIITLKNGRKRKIVFPRI
jgi:hypothetical protein